MEEEMGASQALHGVPSQLKPSGRPRLLDLFCCAGGAAEGYARAGFEVVGVDKDPQRRYPFQFVQADAMTYPLAGFDAVHASPLWYAFTALAKSRGFRANDPDDVTPIYERLKASGLPFVVESGSLGPLKGACQFCGPAFGLQVIRHMYFASNVDLRAPRCACVRGGAADGLYVAYKGSYGKGKRNPPRRSRREWKDAAGLGRMTWAEAHLAVPPAYTEHIGKRLLEHLAARSEAA
jgi:DNA (cytosine-5)-methyltransferase 1